MDPITHSLTGVLLGNTEQSKKIHYGKTAFILGAIAPDIDFLFTFWNSTLSLDLRRGVTHGVLAMIILPLLIIGVIHLFNLKRKKKKTINYKALFIIGFIGCLMHSSLDWMNTYGVRFLMPFNHKWFYLDSMFILDPYLIFIICTGLFLHKKKKNKEIISFTIVFSLIYLFVNIGISNYAKHLTNLEFPNQKINSTMAGAVPLNPFKKSMVIEFDNYYQTGNFNLLNSPQIEINSQVIYKNLNNNLFKKIENQKEVIRFLNWARYPYIETETLESGTKVYILDARYVQNKEQNIGIGKLVIEIE